MPLPANYRLGPYEIKSTLGVGGMGEVYRARDSRLNRDVAVKVLREGGTANAERRGRFEREAHAVAALNHPNIVAVYDFGDEASQQYIVSELVEGESLRALLTGKPLPIRILVDIGAHVADGLAAAHAAGVVHRDLKPENIMLAKDGRAKILDFGLARRVFVPGSPFSARDLDETFLPDPRGIHHLTTEGSVLGTARYMSPEQAIGKEADYRSDQFSFGLILYEMASGKQAFTRSSGIETMAAIVRDEPPPIEEKLPPPLKWIIDRCLAKDPAQRYESTHDLFRDLKNLRDHFSEAYSSGTTNPLRAHSGSNRWKLPSVIAASLLLGAAAAYLATPGAPDNQTFRYTPFAVNASNPAWSPNGKAVAYSGQVNGTDQVFLRYLSSPMPVQLTREPSSVRPLGWSSDRGHLIVLRSTPAANQQATLMSVPLTGGDPEVVMETDCIACTLSPDGRAFATFAARSDGMTSVWISDPIGSPLRRYQPAPFAVKVFRSHPQLHFSPDGKQLLLVRSGDTRETDGWLLPYPEKSGQPTIIPQDLTSFRPTFGWMPDNRHIIVSKAANDHSPEHLWVADTRSSRTYPLTSGESHEIMPSIAPDGRSLLFATYERSLDVQSLSIADGAVDHIVATGREESMPSWALNQPKLAWVTNRNGPYQIWVKGIDDLGRPVVTADDFSDGPTQSFMDPALSPAADRIIYTRLSGSGEIALWVSSLAGGPPVRLTNRPAAYHEFAGAWSPDGKHFIYREKDSLPDGAQINSLMETKTDGVDTPVLLKSGGMGYLPSWSPRGEWIAYRNDKGWQLVSPDGKTEKPLGDLHTQSLAFSKDGKLLYGITDDDQADFFSEDPLTRKITIIKHLGREDRPGTNLRPGIRLSPPPMAGA